ncbi:MAG: ATP-dependent metallopeptidase FtsH/Yme1/Tma family protein [Nitrospirae bacterium]|nr:ATP-dependent metallopeptidase FtsH/Yme1/Tma family protein [Candidatus Manganitrophaceae bacterium]
MEKNQQQFSLWYFIIAFFVLTVFQSLFFAPHVENLTYSDFKSLLRTAQIEEVTLGTQRISGSVSIKGLEKVLPPEKIKRLEKNLEKTDEGNPVHRFTTIRVDDPTLIQDLEKFNVRFAGQVESTWLSTLLSWVLPAIVFVGIWSIFMRRMGGASGVMEIGKNKAKVYIEKETGVTFDDVAGIDEAREELMEIVSFLKTPERYRRLGGNIPKGVLLVGAPGTGKTLLAKAVAGEAAVPFFSMSGSDFVEMFVGVGAARVRDLFARAQEKAPCIIFIDELDAMGKARSMSPMGGNDEREQTLNQLLVQMDGFDTNKGVIIMAATNRPEILDPALLRPGRFDRNVAIDRPDVKGREKILKVHTKGVTLSKDLDLTAIAAKTPGFVGADLANLINEAALLAARKEKDAVEMADFDAAIDRIIGGLEKKNRVINPQEKETVAYHEAGHALIAMFRKHADPVAKISIIPRGIAALGYTQQLPTEDRYLLKKTELLDRLDVLLGGRVAEEIIYNDISTGAQNDLQRATDLSRHMITQYGMSEQLGLVTFESPRSPSGFEMMSHSQKEYSEKTAQTIDEEIHVLLSQSHERVTKTLNKKKAVLEALKARLIEKEVVERLELEALIKEYDTAV